jgi:beta-aspartyl-peptidase (threonine type)
LAVLARGGGALDAVQAAVRVLEDDPVFNAGTGASLNRDGRVEVDASLMDGRRLAAGAVAALADCGRAIDVARAVLEDGEHVLLCGEGAWRFARERGFEPDAPGGLETRLSRARFEAARARAAAANASAPTSDRGTVGASAIDRDGHVAAATSTGGTTYKRPGRIGDTPLIGCGTYADDEGGAASATGIGERIIKVTMTRVAVDAMRDGVSATAAAWRAADELERRTGGEAGIICVDRAGRVGAALVARSMSWAAGRLTRCGPSVVDGVEVSRGVALDDLVG